MNILSNVETTAADLMVSDSGGVITNCWQPTYAGITYTVTNNEPIPDITIRKLEKGYIVKFQSKEYAFEKLESIYKNIEKFYTKDQDKK